MARKIGDRVVASRDLHYPDHTVAKGTSGVIEEINLTDYSIMFDDDPDPPRFVKEDGIE